MTPTTYCSTDVNGLKVFYRKSGPPDAPKLLLLHGYPSASHMFRDLIPQLADRFHVIAPDLPGFGQSDMPSRDTFTYTFKALTDVLEGFTDAAGLDRYALYVFDYGAPTGFRLALRRPERITAIITQNGNAYEEGLSDGWDPIRAYWKEPTQANRDAIRSMVQPETTVWQYTHGVADQSLVSPDGYTLDNHYLARPGADEIQLDLFLDYASNIDLYPQFQDYFRTRQPPLLAIWGRNDPFFLPAGAEAFKRDVPAADVRLLDTGHFALETHASEIATAIRGFLTTSTPAGGVGWSATSQFSAAGPAATRRRSAPPSSARASSASSASQSSAAPACGSAASRPRPGCRRRASSTRPRTRFAKLGVSVAEPALDFAAANAWKAARRRRR